MGRCPDCGEWNSLVETMVESDSHSPPLSGFPASSSSPRQLSQVQDNELGRIKIPINEFSRVLGGGIVPGSLVLIGGDPGIGKSTLLLQISAALAVQGGKVLYVSGEESAQQIKMRARRLNVVPDDLYVLTETNLHAILDHIGQLQPTTVVVDSIQTVYLDEISSAAGSVSQVRECAALLMRVAKERSLPIFLVGHVTKSGAIAGPRVLEHIVDTVLYLEGDRFHAYRLLRSVKNRFGATSEVGVFEMKSEGLVEVTNPSAAFLEERLPNASGSAIAVRGARFSSRRPHRSSSITTRISDTDNFFLSEVSLRPSCLNFSLIRRCLRRQACRTHSSRSPPSAARLHSSGPPRR